MLLVNSGQTSPARKTLCRLGTSQRAGTIRLNRWMALGMELISNRKPERRNVGRNELRSAICDARNWFFVAAEMSSPCPSAGRRNAPESGIERGDRAAEGDAEDQHGDERAQRHRGEAEHEVRHDLPEEQLDRRHRRRHHGLHRPALPLARDDERRQQRADQRHHDRDRARDEEEAAGELRVEPERARSAPGGRGPAARLGRALRRPGRDHALHVRLDQRRRVRVRPVDDDLHFGGGAPPHEVRVERRRNDHDAADVAANERVLEVAAIRAEADVEVGRRLERRGQRSRRRAPGPRRPRRCACGSRRARLRSRRGRAGRAAGRRRSGCCSGSRTIWRALLAHQGDEAARARAAEKARASPRPSRAGALTRPPRRGRSPR